MKIHITAIILLLVITVIGSYLGTTHMGPGAIIAPFVGSIVTSLLFLGFLKWENKITESQG